MPVFYIIFKLNSNLNNEIIFLKNYSVLSKLN